jgi:hypothetical protein
MLRTSVSPNIFAGAPLERDSVGRRRRSTACCPTRIRPGFEQVTRVVNDPRLILRFPPQNTCPPGAAARLDSEPPGGDRRQQTIL